MDNQKIILCIDDMPIRYQDIRCDWAVLITTCRMEDYRFLVNRHKAGLVRIVGVMLDHDMPFQDGVWYADKIREDLHVPVALTSNNRNGRDHMFALLEEYEVPVIHSDCTWPNWQAQAMGFILENQTK
jgi:hypothetical protein